MIANAGNQNVAIDYNYAINKVDALPTINLSNKSVTRDGYDLRNNSLFLLIVSRVHERKKILFNFGIVDSQIGRQLPNDNSA